MTADAAGAFDELSLPAPLLDALRDVGYERPTPIQAQTIPLLLGGQDLVGQAQTGTGKTAAFALPMLAQLDLASRAPQVMVLAPTRELAIQVAEAFATYAARLDGFRVLPLYGGQDYGTQLRALKRGAHVIVGTPGRVMDHMRRGTLALGGLKHLVLDEADEMLRMGFIDDVEWILEQIPKERQIALFSATMPQQIRRIAQRHLRDPQQVTVKVKTATAETVRQRYWPVSGMHKLDALTRILEAEPFDGMIIFVRTRTATAEIADKLQARGFAAAALNGDIAQAQRERTVGQLKNGTLDIIVATDVAARGLDVSRISHVVNYDIPYDTEAYVHRIGRTGRAGRTGEAILFVSPRERRMLAAIERATRQKITAMELPSTEQINDKRVARFLQQITDTLANEDLGQYRKVLEGYQAEHDIPALDIAAALARQVNGDAPLLLKDKPRKAPARKEPREAGARERKPAAASTEDGMVRYRIEVGHVHQVKPGNIVGAIANEAGLDSEHIGRIDIQDTHTLIDLPEGMPKELFQHLRKVWVAGQQLNLSVDDGSGPRGERRPGKGRAGSKPAKRQASAGAGRKKPKHKAKKRPPAH